jgi:hypothetical protein
VLDHDAQAARGPRRRPHRAGGARRPPRRRRRLAVGEVRPRLRYPRHGTCPLTVIPGVPRTSPRRAHPARARRSSSSFLTKQAAHPLFTRPFLTRQAACKLPALTAVGDLMIARPFAPALDFAAMLRARVLILLSTRLRHLAARRTSFLARCAWRLPSRVSESIAVRVTVSP